MEHFICTECGNQSEVDGICETPYCKKEGQSLKKCICADGLHNNEVPEEVTDEDDADIGE